MSKRKAPEAAGRAGKQKAEPELAHMDSQDLLSMALGEESEQQGDLLPSAEDLEVTEDSLAEALCEDEDAFGEETGDDAPVFDDEVGELPEGVDESHLKEAEEVDLKKVELTVPQARRVAQVLAKNSSLTKIKLAAHDLDLDGLTDDELEWDSEEYTDVDAVRACRPHARSLRHGGLALLAACAA